MVTRRHDEAVAVVDLVFWLDIPTLVEPGLPVVVQRDRLSPGYDLLSVLAGRAASHFQSFKGLALINAD